MIRDCGTNITGFCHDNAISLESLTSLLMSTCILPLTSIITILLLLFWPLQPQWPLVPSFCPPQPQLPPQPPRPIHCALYCNNAPKCGQHLLDAQMYRTSSLLIHKHLCCHLVIPTSLLSWIITLLVVSFATIALLFLFPSMRSFSTWLLVEYPWLSGEWQRSSWYA